MIAKYIAMFVLCLGGIWAFCAGAVCTYITCLLGHKCGLFYLVFCVIGVLLMWAGWEIGPFNISLKQ